eukprot:9466213-Pyramimonas_sp.AAC.1
MVAEVWSRARGPEVQGWAEDTCPAWDAAVKGNSAVFEAFVAAVDEGACAAPGFARARAMPDLNSVYDSTGCVELGRVALELGFSPAILALELPQCLAARVLARGQAASAGSRCGAKWRRRGAAVEPPVLFGGSGGGPESKFPAPRRVGSAVRR